jgi:hypothetical protein
MTGPQLSLATTDAFVPAAGTSSAHWTFTGVQTIDGASVSLTVTAKLQLAVLPEASLAVQVTLVVPLANVAPLAGAQMTVTFVQLSLVVTAHVTLLLEH